MEQTNINPLLEALTAMQSGNPALLEQTALFKMASDPAVQLQMHAMLEKSLTEIQAVVEQMRPAPAAALAESAASQLAGESAPAAQ